MDHASRDRLGGSALRHGALQGHRAGHPSAPKTVELAPLSRVRPMRFRLPLLIAVALASNSAVFAAGDAAESQAIQDIERLGALVERDDQLPGRPVTGVVSRGQSFWG